MSMRRLTILLALAFLCPMSSHAQISFVSASDLGNNGGSGNFSANFTVSSGSNRLLVACMVGSENGSGPVDNITAASYNSVAMTQAVKLLTGGPNVRSLYVYFLLGPTSGSNALTATNNGTGASPYILVNAAEYDGVAQSGQPDASTTNNSASATSLTTSLSTVTNSSWVTLCEGNSSATIGAGAGASLRVVGPAFNDIAMFDSNGAIRPPGSYSMTTTLNPAAVLQQILVSFAPSSQPSGGGGQLISAPLLPQVTPSPAYPPDTGYTITPVASGSNLQTFINGATCGTKLNLAHNGTFTTASPWTLPNNSCLCHSDQTKWIIIQGDQFEANYTGGVRVDPSAQYAQFPHLSSSDANSTFTGNANGSSCWGFAGLDVTETSNNAQDVFGINDLDNQTPANFSHDYAWWGDYIHGAPTLNIKRGIIFNGNYGSIVDSYIDEIHVVMQDSNAITGYDGSGPLYVHNNFLESATENFLMGGAVPFGGVQTCDITVSGNHSWKPVAWRRLSPTYIGIHWAVKNAFELKEGCRILVSGNVLEYAWQDGQNGTLFLLNQGSTGGTAPLGYIQDVIVQNNIVRNGAFGLAFGAFSDTLYQNTHRISFSNNLWYNLDGYAWGDVGSCCGPAILVLGKSPGTNFAIYDIWQDHETFAETTSAQTNFALNEGINYGTVPSSDFHYGMRVTNSIIPRGFYGAWVGNSDGLGDAVIASYAPNLVANNDCIYGPGGGQGETYNNAAFSGKQLVTSGLTGVFVNPGTDFHVSASSACHAAASDGSDMGANVTGTLVATANVVQTLANVPTVTGVSPATFTHLGSTSITITGTNFLQESGLGVIVGGAGPTSRINTVSCTAGNVCSVIMTDPISLQTNDTVNIPDASGAFNNQGQFLVASVTDTTHFTYTGTTGMQSWSGGTANRVTPGNACTNVVVVSPTSITCNAPAATGTVTTGPISVFVDQFGIEVQFNGASYN